MRFKSMLVTLPAVLALAACTDSGRVKIPFEKEAPFVATAVPADFAVMVDENHDTYYSRQHIAQVITSADGMSTTTYTTLRDLNNTVSNKFSQETPLKPEQLQSMWNAVSRYDLLNRSTPWINWYSGADLYKHDSNTIQIRANGQTAVYRQNNGFAGAVRPLMLQVEAVRLPLSQNANTRVVAPREEMKAGEGVGTMPATEPAGTMPSLPGSALEPETAPGMPPAVIPANGTSPGNPSINSRGAATAPAMGGQGFTPEDIKNALPRK